MEFIYVYRRSTILPSKHRDQVKVPNERYAAEQKPRRRRRAIVSQESLTGEVVVRDRRRIE